MKRELRRRQRKEPLHLHLLWKKRMNLSENNHLQGSKEDLLPKNKEAKSDKNLKKMNPYPANQMTKFR